MGLIDGTYKHEKNENFLELLIKAGLPEDRAKKADEDRATVTIKVDGKKVLWKYDGLKKFEATLVVGEEVDEPVAEGEMAVSTTKLNGNVLTVDSVDKKGKGTMNRVYTFSDSGFVAVITLDTGVKATRHYKRI
ncbi:unnamed protein product [Psylliodes chrysocephalus]|uniref:Uncharacterized protein n=1 Tax=Psylliodes chrysocephalus TaxID=3402493 RepID=A0A9P0G9R7_9CUCU|nr:unnamed protein product [Psylliodes chrysocephala]